MCATTCAAALKLQASSAAEAREKSEAAEAAAADLEAQLAEATAAAKERQAALTTELEAERLENGRLESKCAKMKAAIEAGRPGGVGAAVTPAVRGSGGAPGLVHGMVEREQAENPRELAERQQGELEEVLKCLSPTPGEYATPAPTVACVVFRSLMHWKSFDAERTNVFDRIVSTMGKAIEASPDDQETLSYWLSTTTTLLFLLQRTLVASQAKFPTPALLFKQQLTALVEKTYGMVRGNVRSQITMELGQCIQAPRCEPAPFPRSSSSTVLPRVFSQPRVQRAYGHVASISESSTSDLEPLLTPSR